MKIYLGADHNGYKMKQQLIDYLQAQGHQVIDQSNQQLDPGDDFPEFASKAIRAMRSSGEPDPKAILICGSGQGMCMAANRFKGVRASLVWNIAEAKAARNDSDSNVLCLPSNELTKFNDVTAVVDTWLKTPFMGAERFVRRIKQLDELE